jgi:class 3 adenylate cyclase/tetratricopeptide (TPR) repeat protein
LWHILIAKLSLLFELNSGGLWGLEGITKMKCPKCQFENPQGSVFCGDCGAALEVSCPSCGSIPPPGFKFCNKCGQDLRQPAEKPAKDLSFDQKIENIQKYLPKGLTEKILSQRDRIEGERKQVTVLFCDMKGFTAFSERVGPDEVYAIMDEVYEILIHKVHDYEGTVNEMTGDGIMALFGAPIAMEDAPQRAIYSAIAIQREMAKFSDRINKENKDIPRFRMRIGIHTGPVVVGTLGNDLRVEFKAVGDTVNTASRMEALAEPGAICVSEETFRLTEGLFRFEALGERKIKGKQAPVKIYRVLGLSNRRTRFDVSTERGLTPFVGRQREIELLMDGFERSREGRGQAISITGEAGLGKSRLLYEFRKAVANEDVTFLEGKCLSYSRNVAYHPVIDILKSNFGISESDGDAEITEKVKSDLKSLEVEEISTVPYFLELLSVRQSSLAEQSLTPEIMKDRIIDALTRILIKSSQRRPVILAIEDLHWVDKSSEEVSKFLLDAISGARVFLIFTYRPEFVHAWGAKSYHSQVNLNRLSNRQSLAIATGILGCTDIKPALEDLILEKTEGVPFFIEEFIKSLMSLKIIERTDTTCRIAGDHLKLTIPATIHDVIMARVDSLPDGAKEVLQTGAVIEREFSYDLIKTVTGLPEKELLAHLSALKDFELLYERGIYPQSTYVFKHALTQEVAHNSLLKKRKKEIHDKIAGAIEGLYPQRLEEFYEKLAYHYSESENFGKAREYLKLSGDKAAEKFSNLEAFRFYQKLIHVLNQLAETETNKKEQISARLSIFSPMRLLAYPQGSLKILEDGAKLSKEMGDTKNLVMFYSLIGKYFAFKGDPLRGRKYQEECFVEASKINDIDIMAPIADDLLTSYGVAGDSYKVVQIVPKVIALLEETKKESEFFDRTNCVYSDLLAVYGLSLGLMGNIKDGEAYIKKGLKHAHHIGHVYSIGWVEFTYAQFLWAKGDARNCIEHSLNSIRCFEKVKADAYLAWGMMVLGMGYYLQGDLDTALEHAQRAYKIQNNLGIPTLMSFIQWAIGVIEFEGDELKKVSKSFESALAFSQENNEKLSEGMSFVWLGRTVGKMDSLQKDKAEECIRRGIEILKDKKIKPYFSHGYLFLGELYSYSDQREKALEYLKKAEDNFREMEMDYWLDRTQEVLAKM